MNLCLSIIGRMLGFDHSVSFHNAPQQQRERNLHTLYLRRCWRQQTSTASITATKVLGSKRAIKKFVPFIPVSEKKRLHNKIDPSLQEYLEWLNINWEEYSAEEHHQPSSSSSWSQTSWKRESAPPLAWVGCLAEWLESIQQQQANHSWQSSHHFWIFRCESLETADWVGWQSCEHTGNWCLWG